MSPNPAEDTTGAACRPLREADLAGLHPTRRLPGRNRTKADILVYRVGTEEIAVKDYAARPWIVRQTVGRWLIRREARAYRAAGPLPGLARFYGRLGPFRLATGWIDATPLHHVEARDVREVWFERLDVILRSLHARGVALADLHRRDVLVTATGSVWIIDLALACVRGHDPGPLGRRIFDRCREADRVALVRLRARFTGGDERRAIASVGRRTWVRHQRRTLLKRWWNGLRRRNRTGRRSGR